MNPLQSSQEMTAAAQMQIMVAIEQMRAVQMKMMNMSSSFDRNDMPQLLGDQASMHPGGGLQQNPFYPSYSSSTAGLSSGHPFMSAGQYYGQALGYSGQAGDGYPPVFYSNVSQLNGLQRQQGQSIQQQGFPQPGPVADAPVQVTSTQNTVRKNASKTASNEAAENVKVSKMFEVLTYKHIRDFLNCVRWNRTLWDTSSALYKDEIIKRSAYINIGRIMEEKGHPKVNLQQLWEELKLEYFTETVRTHVCRSSGDKYFLDVMNFICLNSPFIPDEYEVSLSKRDLSASSASVSCPVANGYPIPTSGYYITPMRTEPVMPTMPQPMRRAPIPTMAGPAVPDPTTTMPASPMSLVHHSPVSMAGSVNWEEDFLNWTPRPYSEPPRLLASEILPWSYEGNRLDLSVPSSRPQSMNAMSKENDFNREERQLKQEREEKAQKTEVEKSPEVLEAETTTYSEIDQDVLEIKKKVQNWRDQGRKAMLNLPTSTSTGNVSQPSDVPSVYKPYIVRLPDANGIKRYRMVKSKDENVQQEEDTKDLFVVQETKPKLVTSALPLVKSVSSGDLYMNGQTLRQSMGDRKASFNCLPTATMLADDLCQQIKKSFAPRNFTRIEGTIQSERAIASQLVPSTPIRKTATPEPATPDSLPELEAGDDTTTIRNSLNQLSLGQEAHPLAAARRLAEYLRTSRRLSFVKNIEVEETGTEKEEHKDLSAGLEPGEPKELSDSSSDSDSFEESDTGSESNYEDSDDVSEDSEDVSEDSEDVSEDSWTDAMGDSDDEDSDMSDESLLDDIDGSDSE